MNTNKIINETKQMDGVNVNVGNNINNDTIIEGNKETDLFSVFNSSVADYNKINKLAGNTKKYRDEIYDQINLYAISLTGKEMKHNKVIEIRNIVNSMNKKIEDITDAEIDLIFAGSQIIFNIDQEKMKEGITDKDLKRVFLETIISTNETDIVFNQAEEELKKINKKFVEDCDNILASVDMTQELSIIAEKLKEETDPEEKKRLEEVYLGMYNSLSLDLVINKINNKPISIIKKECNKQYDIIEKKARKIIINDKSSYFLDIKNLKSSLIVLYPNKEQEIKILLFIIYKQITKRKEVPVNLVNFINYFVLAITKLTNKAFNKNEKMIEYKNKLGSILDKLK